MDYEEETNKWLNLLRERTRHPKEIAKFFQEALAKTGLSLEDFGTSEQEIQRLIRTNLVSEARSLLEQWKAKPIERGYCGEIKRLLDEASTQVGAISTESELDWLWRDGCKRSAIQFLQRFRHGDGVPWVLIATIIQLVEMAECKLKDIGTNLDELQAFTPYDYTDRKI